MTGLHLTGANDMMRRLTMLSRVVRESTEEELRDLANEIEQGSRDRAPEKTGALVDSHKVSEEEGMNGTTFTISVGPVYDGGREYSTLMHEGLHGGMVYNLGPKSQAKNTGTPHRGTGVGWKYLERSFNSAYRRALRRLALAAKKGMKRVAR